MKTDITTKEDVILLVDSFYDKVKTNSTIGFIFNDIAKMHWSEHLPVMYSFWATILLGEQSYQSNPMTKHILLNKKITLMPEHFKEWLRLFTETVNELFEGEKAAEAKDRAASIARLMFHKINKEASIDF